MKNKAYIFFLSLAILVGGDIYAQYQVDAPYKGGISGDAFHWVAENGSVSCMPAYTSVAYGGSGQGAALGLKIYVLCNPDIAYGRARRSTKYVVAQSSQLYSLFGECKFGRQC